MEKMASRAGRLKGRGKRGGNTGRLKERGGGERRGTGRLKERGKRGKHGSPEGEGGGERHAPAKPRLVAVLRSKLRFTRFLQVPTGSHCLSPPPYPSGCWYSYFPYLSTFPKSRRANIVFLPPPRLQADFPYSAFPLSLFFAFPIYSQARIGFF